MMSKIKFILLESMRGFLYARTPVMLSLFTIGVSLVVISLSFYSYMIFLQYSGNFTDDYRIEVFFNSNLDDNYSKELFNTISEFNALEDGEFFDKEKSSIKFSQFFNEKIEDIVGENPLPYSGEFSIKDEYRTLDSLLVLSSTLKDIDGISDVYYDKEIIIRTYNILNKIMTAFSAIGFLIVIVSIILVSNTTRLMIHSKKENIKILSLMGATNLFIRIPFILEGIFQGILGAIVSIIFLFLIKILIEYILSPLVIAFDSNFQFIISLNFILGAIFGLIGSKRAISKYLS